MAKKMRVGSGNSLAFFFEQCHESLTSLTARLSTVEASLHNFLEGWHPPMDRRLFTLFLCTVLAGCTTSIGDRDEKALTEIDFGPPQTVNMCVYLDDGITESSARRLLDSWNEEANQYALYVEPVMFEQHPRVGTFYWQIMKDIDRIPLEEPCDRVIYFANRNAADFLYGVVAVSTGLPEVLGYVDDDTLTHGFVYARSATAAQLLVTPWEATKHELYHLLGCGQHNDMAKCYAQIRQLKQAAQRKKGFFPTFSADKSSILSTREEVNSLLQPTATGLAQVAP
jgi:hypothetical protein